MCVSQLPQQGWLLVPMAGNHLYMGSFWEQEWQTPPGCQELEEGTDRWGFWDSGSQTQLCAVPWDEGEMQRGQCRDTQNIPGSQTIAATPKGDPVVTDRVCGHRQFQLPCPLPGPSSLAGAALCALISILFYFFPNLLFTRNS